MKKISNETKKLLLFTMLKIRRFEERIVEIYPAQEMKTPVHLCIGEEAIASGVCANLKKDDYIFSNHRNHGHCIAKGADIRLFMAEFYGKATGCSKGKGGSMHTVSPECGVLGTSAIVGGGIALAVGTALASKLRRDKRVSVAFFGDGAVDEGIFHESLNFASLKKLPVVFVCENNFYATNSHISARQPHDNIAKRSAGYDIPGIQVSGNDILKVYEYAKEAIKRARNQGGPTLIECRTYRWKGHVGPDCDHEKGCRPKQELEQWMDSCPIELYKKYLFKGRIITDIEVKGMIEAIDHEIESALRFAEKSPFPQEQELFEDVYFGEN